IIAASSLCGLLNQSHTRSIGFASVLSIPKFESWLRKMLRISESGHSCSWIRKLANAECAVAALTDIALSDIAHELGLGQHARSDVAFSRISDVADIGCGGIF